MNSAGLRSFVPEEVEQPSTTQVVPISGITPPGGGAGIADAFGGYSGTALTMRREPDAPAEHLGFVVACPQVPRWMSPEYPHALEEEKGGHIHLEDYSSEWFEKIIYIDRRDLAAAAKAPGGLSWSSALASLGPVLDSVQSDGCATVTARTRVYRVSLHGNGLPAAANLEGVYYTLIWDAPPAHKVSSPALVKEIALAPLAARGRFASTARHKAQLAESTRLARLVDPAGDKARARDEHLRAVRGRQDK